MRTPDPEAPAPPLHVAVVGAGVTGLSTTVRLRAAGHAVTLVSPDLPDTPELPDAPDPEAVARGFRVDGATHAAAGMLAPLTETQHSQDGLAPLLAAAWERWPALLALLAGLTDAPTGHDAVGSLVVGVDRADVEAWGHVLGRAERHGRRARRITGTALRRAAPALAPGLHGGFEAPDDHQLDPRLLVRACLTAVLAPPPCGAGSPPAGLVRARAVAVHPESGAVRVETDVADRVRADVVVLAAGLGHARIAGAPSALPLPLRPVHGDVLRLRVTARLLAPGEAHLLPGPVRALVHGRSVYLVPRADGGLVVGATAREDGDAATPAGAVLDLLADAAAVLPGVRECALEEVLTAARPGTPDDVPLVGALPHAPRVVVATGAHRHGILLAPWMSAAALALVETAAGLPVSDAAALALVEAARLDRFARARPAAAPVTAPSVPREDAPCPA